MRADPAKFDLPTRPVQSRLVLRILLPILGVSLALLTIGVVAAWRIHLGEQTTSQTLSARVGSLRAAEELEILIRELRQQINLFLLTGDSAHLDAAAGLQGEAEHWIAEAFRLAANGRQQQLMRRVNRAYHRFLQEFAQARRQPEGRPRQQALEALARGILTENVLQPAHEYLDLTEEEVAVSSQSNEASADRTALALLLLGSCGAVSGLLAGYAMARGVRRSLVQLSLPIHDAAGKLGEVVGPVTFSSGPNLEAMEEALHEIASRVGTVVERLQQSQRESLRSEQLAAVGQLAAGMAHELRNPLTAIKVLVQSAAANDPEPVLAGRDLVVLENEIDRLDQLLQSLLEFARPPRLQKQSFDVRRTLEQTVALAAGPARLRRTTLGAELPEAPLVIEADEAGLRQVFLNLLLNACDAAGVGGGVCVRAVRSSAPGRRDDSGAWLVVEVADSGPGLPAHLGERIFEPFVSTKETGMGLGLSTCKRIVETHGGQIHAANRPGGGAVFSVVLPMSETSAARGGGTVKAAAENGTAPRRGSEESCRPC